MFIFDIISVGLEKPIIENGGKLKTMTKEEMNKTIVELKMVQSHKKDLEAREAQLKQTLQNAMDEMNVETFNTGVFNVKWRLVERTDIDKKRLEEDGLLDKYSRKGCYPRLDIR